MTIEDVSISQLQSDLAFVAVPKPFQGEFDVIQRNALDSWKRLVPSPAIFLLGEEFGTTEVCASEGLTHVPHIKRNEYGTPLLSSVFDTISNLSQRTVCFINADVLLFRDLLDAIVKVHIMNRPFLLTGCRTTLDITDRLILDDEKTIANVRERARSEGRLDPPDWIDYFAFSNGLLADVPPFAIGRPGYDNWLIWRVTKLGAAVVDATRVVLAVHQRHGYSHAADEELEILAVDPLPSWAGHALGRGREAIRNMEMVGGWTRLWTINHCRWILTESGPRRALDLKHLGARVGIWFRHIVDVTRPVRHALGIRRRSSIRSRS